MAHFAAARRAHAARLAHREGGEVVVQHELLEVLAFEGVDHLFVVAGAEGGDHQGLGLAAGEQRRAVGPGQHAHFGDDLADRVDGAAVDADAGVEDVAADDVGLELLEHPAQLGGVRAVRIGFGLGELLEGLVLGGVDGVLAGALGDDLVGRGEVGADQGLDLGLHRVGVVFGEVEGLLGGVLGQFDDRVDHRLDALVGEHDAAQDLVFAELLNLGLDHHHRVAGGGDDEIHLGLLHLVQRRVEHVLTVDEAHAGAADGAHEGRARQHQGGRGGHQGDDVGVVLEVVGQHGGDHLDLVLEALDEQRADRTVDQAAGQGFLLRRRALAAGEGAGDLAGGVELFLVVHGQGEEVLARFGALGEHRGGQDHGLTVGGEDRAVGLAGDAARFEGQLAAAPLDGFALDIEHCVFAFFSVPKAHSFGGGQGRSGF